ncbi:tripartite tricarboxylate transporter substrate-binding protein [Anaerotalea alkaliphila]|uniref:Tripartite tricarboxylate transporter substrate binding protein n=1 Tax=Anaerotalea alkaliphila TaxID=2662126 RepID=A0A7X5HWL5_9FIRM|nr:tripartite tricarboxylate transporter substrate-binding protein [Anaerotalea alkaliphila]NDL67811.1 hypothetical protein [Anaerotalea alkaliphila]
MKKVMVVLMALCTAAALFTGCGKKEEGTQAASGGNAQAEAGAGQVVWPEGAVNFSVPGKAGGGSDMTARYLTSGWSEVADVNFSVKNFDSTTACFQDVANQKPDGRNIGLAHSAIMTEYVAGSSPVNPVEDLTVIAAVGNNGLRCIAARSDAPYDTIDEMVAYAKENPGTIKVGSSPSGTVKFLMGKIEQGFGITFNYVEASQETDRLVNLAGGFIDIGTISLSNGMEYEAAGKLKVLGTVGADGVKIVDFLPDAPENYRTVQEMGYDVAAVTSYYVIGPKGMDDALVEAINGSMKEIAATGSTFIDGMSDMGQVGGWHGVEDSRRMYEEELASMIEVGKNLGLYNAQQ